MPGTNTRAVAELTLLLMLATLRRLSTIEASLRAGRWTPDSSILAVQRELAGRKVGLVGMGAVPSLLAPVLTAMGAFPRYWNRTERPAAGIPYLPLTELITTSDVLSLHLPLAADTNRIVDVWAMKSCSILINTARGGLVDEKGLVEALRSGHLAGAGLDVFDVEPLVADHPLRELPNVTMTPHLAWLTAETLNRSLEVAVRNVGNLASGSDLDFEVF
jgi:phosphoglycerate dehydrogenase-like enzyme